MASRSRSTSCASATSPRLATSASASASTSISGIKYDPPIGIYGMDFYCCMTRPGERVTRRRRMKSNIGASHRIKRDETVKWFKSRFDGIVR